MTSWRILLALTVASGLWVLGMPRAALAQTDAPSGKSSLPTGKDIVTPPAPPTLVPPTPEVSPVPRPSLEPLSVPQNPLEVRVEKQQELSLAEVLSLAVERNPAIRQAQLTVDQSQAALDQAKASYAPTASSAINYGYNQSSLTGADASQLSITWIQLNYLLIDAGNRDALTEAAEQQLKINLLNLDQTTQETKLNAAEAYYRLQNDDAQVAIRQASVANSEANLNDAQAQERAGIGTRFEVLQAQTELSNNRQALLRAQNDQQLSRRQLAEVLNFADPTDVLAADPIQPSGQWDLSLEDTIVTAFQKRQELDENRRQVDQAKARARAALAANGPTVSLTASAETTDDFQSGGSYRLGYSAGINFNATWADGGAAEANARQSEASAAIATSRFDQNRNGIRREVESAFLSLSSTREQIDSSKTGIASAEESLRLARLRFQAGVGTQTEVISAESALTEARGNLSTAIINYNLSLVQLQRSVAGL